jgi:phospholipid transport system substrate-binding protein
MCAVQTRRMAMTLIGTAALLVAPRLTVRSASAQPREQALTFIKDNTDKLVAIVNDTGAPLDKRLKLKTVLDAAVDHDNIAQVCLGRFWQIATPEQQKEYAALFEDLLVAQIAGHLGEYQGVRITIGLARTFKDTEIVITTVSRPGAPDLRVDWVVSTSTGSPKIVDLVAEGTSMRITQASDFTTFLAHHAYNIQDLIDAMRMKTAQSG